MIFLSENKLLSVIFCSFVFLIVSILVKFILTKKMGTILNVSTKQ
jgi:hypothetical protein